MSRFRTFSQRLRDASSAGKPRLYQTDDLPEAFRVQVIQLFESMIGAVENQWWENMRRTIAHENGAFFLINDYDNYHVECINYMLRAETNQALDMIELGLRIIEEYGSRLEVERFQEYPKIVSASEIIDEINFRFRDHGVGYQYLGGSIIPLSSDYLHSEVIEPAVNLLYESGFRGIFSRRLGRRDAPGTAKIQFGGACGDAAGQAG